jgi:hypothetical protein
MESATSASRRRERVALLTDRAHVGAALVRASQWIKNAQDLSAARYRAIVLYGAPPSDSR